MGAGCRVPGSRFRVQGPAFRDQRLWGLTGRWEEGRAAGPESKWSSTPSPVHHMKVNIRLAGKGNSNSHGARPVHQIISMKKWIRTSRLWMQKSLSPVHQQETRARSNPLFSTLAFVPDLARILRPVVHIERSERGESVPRRRLLWNSAR